MKDYVSPALALLIADYVNDLVVRGKQVDDKAILGAYIAFLQRDVNNKLEQVKIC